MGDRQHYVSQFHLRGFLDPEASGSPDPWLWVGGCKDGTIVRRSPKNFAWSRGLFDGPAHRESTVERLLSEEVEGPAAFALRTLAGRPQGCRSPIPPEVSRYLAWAAARSLPMRQLFQDWIDKLPVADDIDYVEPPPDGFDQIRAVSRAHSMHHPTKGVRDHVPSEDVERLRREGWRLRIGKDDFPELVHLQAWYFQVRFFPRMRWIILDAPPNRFFVISDRPVVWGFTGFNDPPPRFLRHPNVQLFATLTRSIALFAHHPSAGPPDAITPGAVNKVIASAAHEWVAGPTPQIVAEALSQRGSV
jgi:hypothetical protein